jgi:ribonuclease HII
MVNENNGNQLIIGTDEAGYGPNLGPLVISATVWESPTDNLLPLLAQLKAHKIHIGDSKKLYHGGGSLTALEYGILIPLRYLGKSLSPLNADETVLTEQTSVFTKILSENKIRLCDICSRVIEPEEFNRELDRFDSKGTLLSNATLTLIAEILNARHTTLPVLIFCDKHGGRNHYLDLLVKYFPDSWVQVIQESQAGSVYRLTYEKQLLEFRFLAKGESHVPVALASMNSKYLRERAMIRFNEFWREKIPDLKPTAGYPEDAQRFKKDIAAVQKELGIKNETLWRKR